MLSLVSACTSKTEEAEQKYAIVKKTPFTPAAEVCARGKAVADAYLEAGDAAKYREMVPRVNVDCHFARSDEEQGIIRDENGNAMPDIAGSIADNLDAAAAGAETPVGNR